MKSGVERECFRLVQMIAVAKYPSCVRCGEPSTCGHHIFSRRNNATAFDPAAVLGMCAECHVWAHSYPGAGLRLAQAIVGIQEYNRLAKQSMEVSRYRAADFREIRQRLREILKQTGRDLNGNKIPGADEVRQVRVRKHLLGNIQ